MGMCEHLYAHTRTHTLTHTNTGETSQEIIPTTSTAIGHLDCFHNFPLKYYFSRKRLTETLSFRFYTRTSSVLFPPNKYQIKSLFSILLPFPKRPSLCFLLFTTCMCPCCLESHSRSGGWEAAAGQGPGPSAAVQTPSLPSSDCLLGSNCWTPCCCFLARCCTH